MSSSGHIQSKTAALEIIKSYRVPELQALLDYANLPRQGQKRDLLQRCKILIGTSFTPQLANKIQQINRTRLRSTRSNHVSSSSSASKNTPIVLPKTPPLEVLPAANQIQFTSLPFFDKMRTIESSNMPVDWHTFSPLRFTLNETDIDLIRKNTARVFLRIAPTTVQERHNDVLPPYLFVQCNNQPVINNNLSKTVGSQAHSVTFPTDITEKLIFKANASNTLTYLWLQSPTNMSLKNLPKSYTLSIQLVHCVSMDTLFDIIVKREPYSSVTKPSDPDSDIEVEDLGLMTTRHRVSLLCPITQSLISVPAKSANCSHLTCFDLKAFLQMNERRLQWACPLCKKSAAFETLRVDDRLQRVLTNVPANCSTVEIDSSTKLPTDCQYILDSVKQEKMEIPDVPHLADSTEHSSNKSQHQSDDSDCIVLSSGSESEDEDEDEVRQSNDASPLRNNRRDSSNDDRQSSSSKTAQSSPSPLISAGDDRSYWDDLAQITYDLSSDGSAKNSDRKRSNSSTSSILSSASSSSKSISHGNSRKRRKHSSPTSDVEVITLSSSDSSDDDEPSS